MSITGFAQSPYSITNSHKQDKTSTQDVGTQQSSLRNAWVGSKLAYNVDESKPLNESFLLSAKVLYTPVAGDRFAIPVVGNVGLGSQAEGDILNPDAGVNLGIYPWYLLSDPTNTDSRLTLVLHGGLGYKVLTAELPEGAEAPQQLKLIGGLEIAFASDEGLPTTLSVTPVYLFNTNAGVDNFGALEITGILPIANGLGLLAEGSFPFDQGISGQFRLGVIVNSQL
jgi:hypothetical protein